MCKKISQTTAYEISVDGFKTRFSVIPTITLKAKKISVKTKKTKNYLVIENPKVTFRILPLFSGKLHLNTLEASDLQTSVNINKELKLRKDFLQRIENTRLVVDSAKISNFEIIFNHNEVKEPVIYSGKNFDYKYKNRCLKLNLISDLAFQNKKTNIMIDLFLPHNSDISKTKFEVDISNLEIKYLKDYLKDFLPKDLKEVNGIINVKANNGELITSFSNVEFLMEDSAKSMTFPKKMEIKSKFNITKKYIELIDVNIKSKNIDFTISGKIFDYFGKTLPTLDLNVFLNKSRIEDFISMMPAFVTEEFNCYNLKKYKFYGNILGNFSVKGRLPEPDISGDMYINDGILIKRIPNTINGATIKLEFIGKYFNFDVDVPAGNGERVLINGTQELYNVKYADMQIKSTPSVDLEVAKSVVEPLHEILNFIIGPVQIMYINGFGNIDIQVKGNRKNPHIWGEFNIKDSTTSLRYFPNIVLKNADVQLTFNDQNVVFVNNSGKVDGKDFVLKGVSDLFGKFNFDIKSENQSAGSLYKAFLTSPLLKEVSAKLPEIKNVNGDINLDFKVFGNVKSINDVTLNKNTFIKGKFTLKNNNFNYQKFNISDVNGFVQVDSLNSEMKFTANIEKSVSDIRVKINDKNADVYLHIPKFNPNSFLNNYMSDYKNILPFVSILAKYRGDIDNVDFSKIDFKADVIENSEKTDIQYKSGQIILVNNKLNLKNIKGFITTEDNEFLVNLKVDEPFVKKISVDGIFKVKIPDITILNSFLNSGILPQKITKEIQNYEFKNGCLNFDCKISNNKLTSLIDLSGIKFTYLPLELPIEVINGALNLRNDLIKLQKINILADNMPVLIDGEIKDLFRQPNFDLYINSKPKQDFIDKYINKKRVYPLKIKGDIVYWARFKGFLNDFEIKTNLDLSKDASIYHFGATVGDIENAIVLYFDTRVLNGKYLKIKEFLYDKIIVSQSGKNTRLNMLKARGGIEILRDDLMFKDFQIKTTNPTDARIFNIIFRKPNIKQGQFVSDLKFNGKLSNPHVHGDFHIFETNIPFFDTTMKNIALIFRDKNIDITSKGEVMGNEVTFNGVMKNKLSTPYYLEKGTLYTKDLDLNNIVNKLKVAEVENVSTFESLEGFNLNSITFDNLKFKADNIKLRNIHATNYEALTSLNKNGVFNIKSFVFNIAQGVLNGKYQYNLKTNDTVLNIVADNINANDITWALFDLDNQIYGDMTGEVNLSCNGVDFQNCMRTLNGNAIFNVKNGKMPKLGSLEYLLKAGNLIKGGLTGLTINNVLDVVTPKKTGDFSDIYGNITMKEGVAETVDITTKGEDLNLYVSGTYNFATSIADIDVYGLLSRKISTMFGPIGNLSMNTLLNIIPGVNLEKNSPLVEKINKIPGIELSSKAFRKFVAEIEGNIKGENYVTSFTWIN